MDGPRPVGEIIDEAMAELLSSAGGEFHAELVRQPQDNRARIEREVRVPVPRGRRGGVRRLTSSLAPA